MIQFLIWLYLFKFENLDSLENVYCNSNNDDTIKTLRYHSAEHGGEGEIFFGAVDNDD